MTTVTVWGGSSSTDWHTAANWTNGVPTTSLIASIPSAPSNQPIMSSDGTAHALQLDSGATLTGGSNITLYITGESAGETDAPPNGMAVNLDGAISGELSLNINYNNTTSVDLNATSGMIHDLTLNHASLLINSENTCELGGDLIITLGTFNANGNTLDVEGWISGNGTCAAAASTVDVNQGISVKDLTSSGGSITTGNDLRPTNFTISGNPTVTAGDQLGGILTVGASNTPTIACKRLYSSFNCTSGNQGQSTITINATEPNSGPSRDLYFYNLTLGTGDFTTTQQV